MTQAEREEAYHRAIIAAWWAMIETLGWGDKSRGRTAGPKPAGLP